MLCRAVGETRKNTVVNSPEPNPAVPPERNPNLRPCWAPGESGNPGGRPRKTTEDRSAEAILHGTASKAARIVKDAIEGKKISAVQLKAAESCLDRTLGRAPVAVDVRLEMAKSFEARLKAARTIEEWREIHQMWNAAKAIAPPIIEGVVIPEDEQS
jgi:hypothetical protein